MIHYNEKFNSLLDDFDIERDKMRKFSPQINVINVSNNPINYISDIDNSGFFIIIYQL